MPNLRLASGSSLRLARAGLGFDRLVECAGQCGPPYPETLQLATSGIVMCAMGCRNCGSIWAQYSFVGSVNGVFSLSLVSVSGLGVARWQSSFVGTFTERTSAFASACNIVTNRVLQWTVQYFPDTNNYRADLHQNTDLALTPLWYRGFGPCNPNGSSSLAVDTAQISVGPCNTSACRRTNVEAAAVTVG